LGNPGRKYAATRHNVGFRVLGQLAQRFGQGRPRARFDGELVEAAVGGTKVWLLCPHTYMNRSGSSVQSARDFYKLNNEELLIVCDDFNLPLAKLRFRASGSSGGQKGLADVIRLLGSDRIPRLRIGVGTPPEHVDGADFVLSRFTAEEEAVIDSCIQRAAEAVEDWVVQGVDYCMNRYNAG
jgi:PTH1 family peptidyl-tRNA hydrolase